MKDLVTNEKHLISLSGLCADPPFTFFKKEEKHFLGYNLQQLEPVCECVYVHVSMCWTKEHCQYGKE